MLCEITLKMVIFEEKIVLQNAGKKFASAPHRHQNGHSLTVYQDIYPLEQQNVKNCVLTRETGSFILLKHYSSHIHLKLKEIMEPGSLIHFFL